MSIGVLPLIKTRRSVRNFKKKDIPLSVINKILEAGRWAPSGLNNQPWKFVVVKNAGVKERLAKFTASTKEVKSAPALIAVLLDKGKVYSRLKDLQAIGACIQNMLLAIHGMKLGGVWLGEIVNRSKEVERALSVPTDYELMAVIAIGYPEKKPRNTSRRSLESLIYKKLL